MSRMSDGAGPTGHTYTYTTHTRHKLDTRADPITKQRREQQLLLNNGDQHQPIPNKHISIYCIGSIEVNTVGPIATNVITRQIIVRVASGMNRSFKICC